MYSQGGVVGNNNQLSITISLPISFVNVPTAVVFGDTGGSCISCGAIFPNLGQMTVLFPTLNPSLAYWVAFGH